MTRAAENERLRLAELVTLADALRTAQRAYMADRGNDEKGLAVAAAAEAYDDARYGSSMPKYCQCKNTVTASPCIVCGRPKLISKEWFERKVALEGNSEIGAGRTETAQKQHLTIDTNVNESATDGA